MRLLDWLATEINRRRHRRGFGVHSPFGFYFITQVIAEGRYGYYCYSELDQLANNGNLSPKRIRLLMRIAGALGGREVVGLGTRPAENAALRAYHSSTVLAELSGYAGRCADNGEKGLVYLARPDLNVSMEELQTVVNSGGTVIVAGTDTRSGRKIASLIEPLGMTFAGKDMSIIVGGRGLPAQRIETVII